MIVPPTDFKLSAVIPAHSQDARDLCFLSDALLASVSRDHTAKTWATGEPGSAEPTPVLTLEDHQGFVNSAAALIPPAGAPGTSYLATGGADRTIHVHEPASGALVYTLIGHSDNVCVLGAIPGSPLGVISGSWDKTARVWINGEPTYTLTGHAQAVWGVLALDATTFITAAADRTIKFWSGEKCTRTISAGHSDVVRALAYLPAVDLFASCSNDGKVIVWTRTGELVMELDGHTSFVYKVVSNPVSGELVSCGEDRSVRIWRDESCIQTIPLPATSVWSVAVSPDGATLAACTSDGMIYVFSRHEALHAIPEVAKAYEEALASSSIPQNQVGDIKKDELPGVEALANPGTNDGQVLMVRTDGGNVEAHQWSVGGNTWIKIGDVVDAIGSGRKQMHEGKEYDYVFDIDLGGGPGSFLKLPYNVAENPYSAAQQFIWKNELSQEFLDEIARFIMTNTKGHTIATGPSAAPQYADPFTGSSRYTPAESRFGPATGAPAPAATSAPGANASSLSPWTSGYTTSTLSSQRSGASSSSAARGGTGASRAASVPVRIPVTFQQINYSAIATKLIAQQQQFGAQLNPRVASAVDVETHPWSVAAAILQHPAWPADQAFPALDLLRYFVLSHELDDAQASSTFAWITKMAGSKDCAMPVALMAMRVLANMFHLIGNRARVVAELPAVLQIANEHRASANKNVRIGAATVLLNAAIHMVLVQSQVESMNVIALLVEMVPAEEDHETLYRVVAGLGTMASLGASVKPYMVGLGVRAVVQACLQRTDLEERTRHAAVDTIALL
ncbi:WD40-repeat-containing domain protein [Blastocladiella britannica]|nr:WD40-repeat-containing domain protein [Blastocladiella britannica]